jgi:hypothetical protein
MVNRAKGCMGDLNETCEEARQQVMGRILWLKKNPARRQSPFTQQYCS